MYIIKPKKRITCAGENFRLDLAQIHTLGMYIIEEEKNPISINECIHLYYKYKIET